MKLLDGSHTGGLAKTSADGSLSGEFISNARAVFCHGAADESAGMTRSASVPGRLLTLPLLPLPPLLRKTSDRRRALPRRRCRSTLRVRLLLVLSSPKILSTLGRFRVSRESKKTNGCMRCIMLPIEHRHTKSTRSSRMECWLLAGSAPYREDRPNLELGTFLSRGISGGQVRSGSGRFGRILDLVRFGQVHREPGPNLTIIRFPL